MPSSATKGLSARNPPTTSNPPSVVRSVRFSGTRQQACGRRRKRDVEHGLGRRHLEIERLRDRRLEPPHVVVVDVAAVLAQMRGDPVGPRLDGEERRAHGIGRCAAARVADGGDVVDVDAQADRGHRKSSFLRFQAAPASDRLPGLTAGSAASSGGSASAG